MPIAAIFQLLKTFWWVIPILGCGMFYFLWRHSAERASQLEKQVESYTVNHKSEDKIHTDLQEIIIKRKVLHDYVAEPLNIPKEDQHPLAPNVLDALKRMRDDSKDGNSATGH